MKFIILFIFFIIYSSIESHPIEIFNSTKESIVKKEIDAFKKLLLSIVHCESNYCSICSHLEIETINLNETS